MDLQAIWFVLLGLLLAGYAVLDGFDFGVGILHPLAKTDRERRVFIESIGPIWDGNEVWLVTFGGAMFAAFPEVYATIFSGFYLAFMLLLFSLILRAVSIEFRSKIHSPAWKRFWDGGFFTSSVLATVIFGVAVGNAMVGVPLDERGEFVGTFLGLLNPYAILVGVLSLATFAMHGALFLDLKTPPGELRDRIQRWVWHTWGVFLALFMLTTMYTLVRLPDAAANFRHHPWAALVVVLLVLAIANIPRARSRGHGGQAFLSSCLTIVCVVFLFGMAIWPNLVVASNDPALSLTIRNASSSLETLRIMWIIALIGMPFVLGYTAIVYWTFRGRVDPDGESTYGG